LAIYPDYLPYPGLPFFIYLYILMTKYLILFLLLIPFPGNAQKASLKSYREMGDTIFINGKRLLPGDTLHLGFGSTLDKTFNYIWQKPSGQMNGAEEKLKYLPKNYSNGYLIYGGRIDEGFGMMKLYYPVFYDPHNKSTRYNVLFLRAIESGEIKGF
jgi:hypothetical protein